MIKTELITVLPPEGLIVDCRAAPYQGKTNGELLEAALEALALLSDCNQDNKNAYNHWRDKHHD